MTQSVILTQPVRVGGSVLAAGTTQTLSDDIAADLVARGFATPVGAPSWESGSNHHLAHVELGAGVGAKTITYTAGGMVDTHDGWTMQYDASSGIAISQTNGIKTQTFQYDADGRYTGFVEN